MKLSIGLEIGSEDEAIGIVVPALYIGDYGCFSGADDEDQILPMVQEAIALVLEDMADQQPELIPTIHDKGIRVYRDEPEWVDFTNWMVIDFDVSAYLGSQKRINVSLAEGLITSIDACVQANKGTYRDRSHFLEVAAKQQLRQG